MNVTSNTWKLALAIAAAVFGLWLFAASRTAVPSVLKLGAGSPDGRYSFLASVLIAHVEDELERDLGARIAVVYTAGSIDNLERLERGELDLAFYQEGTGHCGDARTVANLEREVVLLVARREANVKTLADLAGRRVGVGPPGSGTQKLATQVLQFYPVQVDAAEVTFDEAARGLREGDLDATFFVAGIGAPIVIELLADESCALVPLPFASALALSHSWALPATIPAETYRRAPRPMPQSDVATLAVRSSLIAHRDVPAVVTERLCRAILDGPYAHEAALFELRGASKVDFARTHTPFPLHTGARAHLYPWEPKVPSDYVESWNGLIGMAVILFSAIYTVVINLRRLRQQRLDAELLEKKDALDHYINEVEQVCHRVTEAETIDALQELRRDLNVLNKRASHDYREERFRSSDDFTAFTTQALFVLEQIQAKLREVRARS